MRNGSHCTLEQISKQRRSLAIWYSIPENKQLAKQRQQNADHSKAIARLNRLWKDPKYIEEQSMRLRMKWQNEVYALRMSQLAIKRFNNSEFRSNIDAKVWNNCINIETVHVLIWKVWPASRCKCFKCILFK